jgi:hypothetical protein
VILPVHWNGHFLFFGCGGFCGALSYTSGAVSTNMVDVNRAANWSCNPSDQRMLQVERDGVTAGADRSLIRLVNADAMHLSFRRPASAKPRFAKAPMGQLFSLGRLIASPG